MAVVLVLPFVSCYRPRHTVPGGPVVLITLDALRADAVGGLGGDPRATPYLTRFLRQADWSGRGVASSSWSVPAMASLFTGLAPWQHHAILDGDAELADDLLTLPRAFKALGYHTAGFSGGRWYTAEYGYDRGFDTFDVAGRNREAAELLESLEAGKSLVWVHITQPDAPFVRRDWLLPRLAAAFPAAELRALPRIVEPAEIEAHADPAAALPPAELRRLKLMYLLNVAWADEKVGRLLDALQASGQWERSLVVVAADYGEELGESGVVGHGDDLARQSLEVPLAIKLPSWYRRPLVPARGQRVALSRVWATLVEAAGGLPPPAMAPSLFHDAAPEVLSELYSTNGANLYSLLSGDDQLLWEARFAPADPRLHRALLAEFTGTATAPGGADSFGVIASHLYDAFAAALPLSGATAQGGQGGPPRLSLWHWDAGGGASPRHDPDKAAALARRLAARWGDFIAEQRTPDAEDRAWIDQLPGETAPGKGD